jgi:hypothetical protein
MSKKVQLAATDSFSRKLSDDFIKDLKAGVLLPFLQLVKSNKEHLILEIRKNYVNIYYRGGCLFKIGRSNKNYKCSWDGKYLKKNDGKPRLNPDVLNGLENKPKNLTFSHTSNSGKNSCLIKSVEDSRFWCDRFKIDHPTECHFNFQMDNWFKEHPKLEKFIQQQIVSKKILKNYLITDFELQIPKEVSGTSKRFDLMAINTNENLLAFIELKQGYSTLKTTINRDRLKGAGLYKHLKDVLETVKGTKNIARIIEQSKKIIDQKENLGLATKNNCFKNINKENYEVVFALANYTKENSRSYSKYLRDEITNINKLLSTELEKEKFIPDIKFVFLKVVDENNKLALGEVLEEDNEKGVFRLVKGGKQELEWEAKLLKKINDFYGKQLNWSS